MRSFYTQEAGKFHLHGQQHRVDEHGKIVRDEKGEMLMEEAVVCSSEKVTICYCKAAGVASVLAYGSPEQMEPWLATHNKNIAEMNEKGAKDSPELRAKKGHGEHEDLPLAYAKTFDQSVPIMTLNKAVEDSTYFAYLLGLS
jgi:hypothetical protein